MPSQCGLGDGGAVDGDADVVVLRVGVVSLPPWRSTLSLAGPRGERGDGEGVVDRRSRRGSRSRSRGPWLRGGRGGSRAFRSKRREETSEVRGVGGAAQERPREEAPMAMRTPPGATASS